MKTLLVIPARTKSSRFPGKPLAKINNKEMIIWVAETCRNVIGNSNVIIAKILSFHGDINIPIEDLSNAHKYWLKEYMNN